MKNHRSSFIALVVAALVAALVASNITFAHAQTSVVAPHETSRIVALSSGRLVVNRVLDNGVEATLTIPRAWLPNANKSCIALYESGRPAIVAEAKRTFETVGDSLRRVLRLEIAPGNYEIRLVRDDKTRTPFSPTVSFQINGLRREPGAWLFNGSMFVDADKTNDTDAQNANAPLFIAGLKRDLGAKAKKISRNIYTNAPLSYRVLELPLRANLDAANFDFAAFQTRLQKQIADAQASGQRNYLGFVLTVNNLIGLRASTEIEKTAKRNAMTRIRQIISTVAPDAALIYEIDDLQSLLDAQTVEIVAPLCDAVVLKNSDNSAQSLWVVKMLRRVAEEQPNYDLPIFVQARQPQMGDVARDSSFPQILHNLDALMSGATSLIEYSNEDLQRALRRNSSLFVNSVTIEDIGVLPSREPLSASNSGDDARLYIELREIGRIPLLARLPQADEKKTPPESFLFRVGERISRDTIDRLRANVERGVRIYIEGAPQLDTLSAADLTAWSQLVGGTSKATVKKKTIATMSEPWTFGTVTGTRLNIEQSVVVTPNLATLAARTKVEAGVDVLVAPRVLATTEDGSPALVLTAINKGQVLWMPHRVLDVQNEASRAWYQAMSAQVQSGLVTLRDENGAPLSAPIRVALRRSPKGALLLGIFNPTAKDVSLRAGIEGIAALALDLATEKELAISKQGNQSSVPTTVAANSWKLIAFGADRKAFDAERNTPLFAAKIK